MLKINWKLWSRFVIQSVSFIFLKYNLKEKQIDNNENFTLIQIYEAPGFSCPSARVRVELVNNYKM